MNIAFLGSTQPATIVLDALARVHNVTLVVTQPPTSRGSKTTTTPVYSAAERLNLVISSEPNDIIDADVDLAVLAAYGSLIREPLLSAMTILNVHPSLLPRWRGASPVESAILAGDTQTGVCIMQIVKALDAGPIFVSEKYPLSDYSYADETYDALFTRGSGMLLDLLNAPLPTPMEQVGEATYAEKFSRDDFRINWNGSAEQALRQIRCNRAWTTLSGEDFRIVRAELLPDRGESGSVNGDIVYCRDAALRMIEVLPTGKRRMSASDWMRGHNKPQVKFI